MKKVIKHKQIWGPKYNLAVYRACLLSSNVGLITSRSQYLFEEAAHSWIKTDPQHGTHIK